MKLAQSTQSTDKLVLKDLYKTFFNVKYIDRILKMFPELSLGKIKSGHKYAYVSLNHEICTTYLSKEQLIELDLRQIKLKDDSIILKENDKFYFSFRFTEEGTNPFITDKKFTSTAKCLKYLKENFPSRTIYVELLEEL